MDLKEQIIQVYLMQGVGFRQLAQKDGMSRTTICKWVAIHQGIHNLPPTEKADKICNQQHEQFTKLTVLFAIKANSQITKSNWIIGGSGSFSIQRENLLGDKIKSTHLLLSPNVGYFLADKFAVGVNLFLNDLTIKRPLFKETSLGLGAGPFLRYYFLSTDNRINLFAHTAYLPTFTYNDGYQGYISSLTFSTGPVLYFNSSVGLELTANYNLYNYNAADTDTKTFYIAAGLQIHLEKND